METLSSSKFRPYSTIVARFILMVFYVGVACFLINPLAKVIGGGKPENYNRALDAMIIGIACLFAVLVIRNIYKLATLMFGRIDIYKDTLRDKYIRVVTHTDDDGHTHETYYYYLYFDQIFGRFKKQTEVSQKVYNQTEIGKDYYIGIVHGMQSMKVYSVEQYRLTATAEHALIPDAKELERRTHWRWYAPEEQPVVNDGGVKRITPEQIVDDMNAYWMPAKDKRSKVSSVISGVFAFLVLAVVFGAVPFTFVILGGFNGLLVGLGSFLVSVLPIILIFRLVRFLTGGKARIRKKEILAGHYKVVLDKVEATEEHDTANFSYRFIHEQMPVRLASGHTVNLSRSKFNNVRPGDNLYIVYMETGSPFDDKSIIAVYQEKLGKLDFGFEVTWAS